MPFDWYHSDLPPIDAAKSAEEMYRRELSQRATLLLRLGYSKADAALRLATNVAWDFELHPAPAHQTAVSQIVDEVYKKRGATGGGPPKL